MIDATPERRVVGKPLSALIVSLAHREDVVSGLLARDGFNESIRRSIGGAVMTDLEHARALRVE